MPSGSQPGSPEYSCSGVFTDDSAIHTNGNTANATSGSSTTAAPIRVVRLRPDGARRRVRRAGVSVVAIYASSSRSGRSTRR
jgi:hypothetical protein